MKAIRTLTSENGKAVEITKQGEVYNCFFFVNYSERLLSYFNSSKDYKSLKSAQKSALNYINK